MQQRLDQLAAMEDAAAGWPADEADEDDLFGGGGGGGDLWDGRDPEMELPRRGSRAGSRRGAAPHSYRCRPKSCPAHISFFHLQKLHDELRAPDFVPVPCALLLLWCI